MNDKEARKFEDAIENMPNNVKAEIGLMMLDALIERCAQMSLLELIDHKTTVDKLFNETKVNLKRVNGLYEKASRAKEKVDAEIRKRAKDSN